MMALAQGVCARLAWDVYLALHYLPDPRSDENHMVRRRSAPIPATNLCEALPL